MYKVLKTIYFADKEHLHRYGRFMFGDSYVAMRHGPVPSKSYDLVKSARAIDERPRLSHASNLFTVRDDTIVPLVHADPSMLSKSDVECLDRAIEVTRPLTFSQLKRLSHDAAYEQTGENDEMSLESIAALAGSDADMLLRHLADPHPG